MGFVFEKSFGLGSVSPLFYISECAVLDWTLDFFICAYEFALYWLSFHLRLYCPLWLALQSLLLRSFTSSSQLSFEIPWIEPGSCCMQRLCTLTKLCIWIMKLPYAEWSHCSIRVHISHIQRSHCTPGPDSWIFQANRSLCVFVLRYAILVLKDTRICVCTWTHVQLKFFLGVLCRFSD